ncbi:MAG: extracellular solute-binding protein [bacterium]
MKKNIFNIIKLLLVLTGVLFHFQCSFYGQRQYDTQELKTIIKNINLHGGIKPPVEKENKINWIGYWKNEGKRKVLIHKVLDEFSLLHQNVQVNMKFPEDIAEIQNIDAPYFEQIPRYVAKMIKNDSIEWDIIPIIGAAYSLIGKQLNDPDWGHKYLVDFRNVPGFDETQKDFILNDPKYMKDTDGIYIGPCIEGYYYAIFYNKEVADIIGLNVKHFNMKFEDLLNYVKEVADYNKQHGTNFAAFHDSGDWVTIEILFQHLFKSAINYSSEYTIPDYFTQKNKRGLLQTLKAFEELGKYDPLIESAESYRWDNSKGVVLNNKALFYVNGSWMYNNWEVIDKEKVKKMIPAELPVFDQINYYMGGYSPNFAVLKNSPNKDLAIELLMHWTNKDFVQDWIRYAKSPSGTYGYMDAKGFGGDVHEVFVNSISEKYGNNIGYYDTDLDYLFGSNHSIPYTRFCQYLHALLRREKTAQEVFYGLMRYF